MLFWFINDNKNTMQLYQIHFTKNRTEFDIQPKNCIEFEIQPKNCIEFEIQPLIPLPLLPLNNDTAFHSLLDQDVFELDTSNNNLLTVREELCPMRSTTKNHAGVLVLHENKTYGHQKKKKMWYKCIPENSTLPPFFIPYEIKQSQFQKIWKNKYVTFQFQSWDKSSLYPCGILTEVLGDVDDFSVYCEFQLVAKELKCSFPKFLPKLAHEKVKEKKEKMETIHFWKQVYPHIEWSDRTTNEWIITLDKSNTLCFDDAVGFKESIISVYISNVPLWLDVFSLWNDLQTLKKVESIYLPTMRKPLLPTILTDELCSLKSGAIRPVLFLDMIYNATDNSVEYVVGNALIRVNKNYNYDDVLNLQQMQETFSHINATSATSANAKEFIAELMIHTNKVFLDKMASFSQGICRKYTNVTHAFLHFVQGSYVDLKTESNDAKYMRMTSPIRRLTDCLNMIKILELLCHVQLPEAIQCYRWWTSDDKMDFINKNTKQIQKTMTQCKLLWLFQNENKKYEGVKKGYQGMLLQHLHNCKYSIYVPELKLTTTIVLPFEKCENGDKNIGEYINIVFYLFECEHSLTKKIKCQQV